MGYKAVSRLIAKMYSFFTKTISDAGTGVLAFLSLGGLHKALEIGEGGLELQMLGP